jgi:hypothetical protein
VGLPAGTLEPGARYTWSVEASSLTGERFRGLADFVTLPRDVAEARSRLRQDLAAEDPALVEALDHELGLAAP